MFSSELEFYQFLAIQSAIRKQEAESRRFYGLFQSKYADLLRLAQLLIRSYRGYGLDVEPAELVNECFIELQRKASSPRILMLSDPQQLINFARVIMRNLMSNRIRVGLTKEHKQIEIENIENFCAFENDVRMVDLYDVLEELAAKYPHLSIVVEYRYLGFSNKEIADRLDRSPHSVAKDWTKARLWLTKALGVTKYQAMGEQQSTPKSPIRLITFTKELYNWLLENPTRLRSLSDNDFEELVADRLAAMGLGVQKVGNVNRKDGGVDLLAWPERSGSFPFLLAAQVKHHRTNRKTGPSDIRDFLGVLTSQGSHFHFGVIVTNTSFSADAEWFAKNNSKLLRLRDLNDLCRWMRDDFINEFEWREIPDYVELAPGVTIEIPKKRLWIPSLNY